ncbi:DnaD domain-containing protein [Paenibacillus sp. FSL R5-0887]|jgi:DNA replication protein|uniref:DnaD domain-containing protein n=1 Tax=Paenibacillus TaxID=44249 RepID=UPI00096D83F4|nr:MULTISPECIES: DnaD domain-containing protein [Paenibacillus]MDH6427749.1 DNA replication protein [Paenibacillus sp. PastH-4]MDH6444626.1 DNA replication protein [Paenibacillus sp. PastF-4]MDH6528522.1 DNA replication protein [Paenibacillus sp. PastH-3]OMD63540.1 DNA replication protein DnaD [Paenibacillus odorifer]OMD93789.1 DNA replication protein DnaD [Paenibacillus odorifer]
MDGKTWSTWSEGVSFGLENGMAVIPYALLKYYRKLNLSGSEAMLLIHLLSFRQVEGIEFPSLEELQVVTGRSISVLAGELQKLMKEGFISIDGDNDELRDIHYERYNFSGLYGKLGAYLATAVQENEQDKDKGAYATSAPRAAASGGGFGTPPTSPSSLGDKEESRNLFSIFEKEFGRPLSPMECETISSWVDQDRYPEELILLALKESVFAGKVHFRYIDRILLEWARNRVKNAQDVKTYTQKFRNGGR